MEELNKLKEILEENNIEYINKSVVLKDDGIDLIYNDYDISVVSHQFSYGGKQGLLEMMADFIENSIQGWLKAEQVYEIMKELGGKENAN